MRQTGYSYFGARFPIAIGSSDLSVWLSVDPMADKYPSSSPFMYVRGNPVVLVDPNGMWDEKPERFGFGTRVKNWIKGNSYKNHANKFQVKNGFANSYEDENGKVHMKRSFTYENHKTNSVGIIEAEFVFGKDNVSYEQRNSTTAKSSKIGYTNEQFYNIKGGSWVVGQSGGGNTTYQRYDSNPDETIDLNWDGFEIKIRTKNEEVPLLWMGGDSTIRYDEKKKNYRYYMNGDTIRMLNNKPFDPDLKYFKQEWESQSQFDAVKKINK